MESALKYFIKLLTLSLLPFLFYGCAEDKPESNQNKSDSAFEVPQKTMCELLPMSKMSSMTGIVFNEEISTVHQTDESMGKYVSQCGYYSPGKNIAVLVRRFGNTSFPKEKEKIIGGDKTGDAEIDELQENALKTCKTVTDLGDAAYFYDLGGIYNLIVVYKDYYQIHISSYGKDLGFDDNTLNVSRKVVEEVMKIFH